MKTSSERILLVESDPAISDLVARQTLAPLGYPVRIAHSATAALSELANFHPEVIITDLRLPDLSGKDLLVAFSSQGVEAPIIAIARGGMEHDLIQAFRLGASDYLVWPMREAEILVALERVLKPVRTRRERENLGRQLKQANHELQQRVRELTTIFAIGKAVTSITNQRELFEKIVEGAVYVSEASCGWLLLRSENTRFYNLVAQRNLPRSIAARLNQPWEDGISFLVVRSGESLVLSGEPLARLSVSQLGQSALIVPIKLKQEVVGILAVMRKTAEPFSPSNKTLLEAVADYASISIVNTSLFRALEDRARSMQNAAESAQASDRKKNEALHSFLARSKPELEQAIECLESMKPQDGARLDPDLTSALYSALENLRRVSAATESLLPSE